MQESKFFIYNQTGTDIVFSTQDFYYALNYAKKVARVTGSVVAINQYSAYDDKVRRLLRVGSN